jgi:Protein of unknown function (DUF3568)
MWNAEQERTEIFSFKFRTPNSAFRISIFSEEVSMAQWKRGVWIILLLFMATGGTGCGIFLAAGAGAAVGVGTAEYIGGELKQAYAAPMEKTWNAALAAADELKVKTTEKSIDNLDQNRVIKGKTEEGKDLQVSLEKMGKDVTMVKVRIGLFGDEKASRAIHESIAKNLKK